MSASTSDGLSRRLVLGAIAAMPALPGLLDASAAQAETGPPLASWNDGPAKQAILDFVRVTTDPSSKDFVPPEERIATFDQDGTLWVSHPIYTQLVFCLDRVPVVVKEKPALARVEPFKTVLTGDFEKISTVEEIDQLGGDLLLEGFRALVDLFYYTGTIPSAVRYKNWKMYYTMEGSTAASALAGAHSYGWTQMTNLMRDPFEQNVGDIQKSATSIGGAITAPSTAYL